MIAAGACCCRQVAKQPIELQHPGLPCSERLSSWIIDDAGLSSAWADGTAPCSGQCAVFSVCGVSFAVAAGAGPGTCSSMPAGEA
jgi:hypothetical protein